MMSSNELVKLFFHDLKTYNSTNFRTLSTADLSKKDPVVHKAFSSVVTRYFIFKERHPEISETEQNILYFKLKLDLVAKYFAEYPDTTPENLIAFQIELNDYIKHNKNSKEGRDDVEVAV